MTRRILPRGKVTVDKLLGMVDLDEMVAHFRAKLDEAEGAILIWRTHDGRCVWSCRGLDDDRILGLMELVKADIFKSYHGEDND